MRKNFYNVGDIVIQNSRKLLFLILAKINESNHKNFIEKFDCNDVHPDYEHHYLCFNLKFGICDYFILNNDDLLKYNTVSRLRRT